MQRDDDITQLLLAVGSDEEGAWDRLFERVYPELKRVARGQLRRLRPGRTLDTTGLVHEAYLKFVDQTRVALNDRGHFYAVAARAMRQILVDHARRLARAKRGAGVEPDVLDEARVRHPADFEQVLAIDQALSKLASHSERQAQVVEYRYFLGLTETEIGELLSVTSRTVRNDWTRAKAWLSEAMQASETDLRP